MFSTMNSTDQTPDQDTTRLRLLEAAEEIFAEKRYEAATVRDICERAGVKNIGAINYYFQGKDRLYAEAVKFALRCCSEGAPFPDWPAGTPPERKLRDFIRVMMTRLLEAPKIASMRLWMRELVEPTDACAEAVQANIRPMAELLRGIVAELLPAVPDEKRWLIGFSIVGQCLYHRQNWAVTHVLLGPEQHARLTAELLAGHIADFTLAALGSGRGGSRQKTGGSRRRTHR
jgi:TetR/AcrR family transcriptional regulator, regulator of cefoperazone and chloramphenicol sensitivity